MNDIIALVAVICIFGLPMLIGIILGYHSIISRHKERMGLINQGIIPPDTPKRKATPNRLISLRNGIVLSSLGIGIIVGMLFSDNIATDWIGVLPMAASIVFFLGVGYLVYFFVTRKMTMPPSDNEPDLPQE